MNGAKSYNKFVGVTSKICKFHELMIITKLCSWYYLWFWVKHVHRNRGVKLKSTFIVGFQFNFLIKMFNTYILPWLEIVSMKWNVAPISKERLNFRNCTCYTSTSRVRISSLMFSYINTWCQGLRLLSLARSHPLPTPFQADVPQTSSVRSLQVHCKRRRNGLRIWEQRGSVRNEKCDAELWVPSLGLWSNKS